MAVGLKQVYKTLGPSIERGPHLPGCPGVTWTPGWGSPGRSPAAGPHCASPPQCGRRRSPWRSAGGTGGSTQSPELTGRRAAPAGETLPSCPSLRAPWEDHQRPPSARRQKGKKEKMSISPITTQHIFNGHPTSQAEQQGIYDARGHWKHIKCILSSRRKVWTDGQAVNFTQEVAWNQD